MKKKNSRSEKWLTKKLRCIFGTPYVSQLAYGSGVVGLALGSVAFALATFYQSGWIFIAALLCGFMGTFIGLVGGLSTNKLHRYYLAIKVTPQELRIQKAFNDYFCCYMRHDFLGCENVISRLKAEDKILIFNEIPLLYLVNHQKRLTAQLEQPHTDSGSTPPRSPKLISKETPPQNEPKDGEHGEDAKINKEDNSEIKQNINDVTIIEIKIEDHQNNIAEDLENEDNLKKINVEETKNEEDLLKQNNFEFLNVSFDDLSKLIHKYIPELDNLIQEAENIDSSTPRNGDP